MQNILNILQGWLVDSSPGTALDSRSCQTACVPSLSRNRLSGGQNVFAGVLVSVQMFAAVFAIELTHVQTELNVNMSARETAFARWVESVRNPQLPTVPSALVFQHLAEHPEAGATDMLCQPVILDHATHVQVFDGDYVKPAHQVRRQFVERVFPTVGDVRLQPGDFELLQTPAATTLHAAGQDPLQPRQFHFMRGGVARVGDSSAITQGCQPADSKVNPDLTSGLGKRGLGWLVQRKTHEVSPGTILDYRDRDGLTREGATPLDAEVADFGNGKIVVGSIPLEPVDCVFSGLLAIFTTELGIGRPLGKEVGKRGLQVTESLLLRNTGRFPKPSELRVATVLRPSCAAGDVVDRLAISETICAESQREIVGVPSATKLTSQPLLLLVARIDSECLPNFHKRNVVHVKQSVNT